MTQPTQIDRTMLVTGAAQGIGRGIAQAAVQAGYRVGLIDVDPSVSETGAELGAPTYHASITDSTAIASVIADFGTPDVLINNAGIVRFGPLIDLSPADWQAVVDVNLTGLFMTSQAVARGMIDRGSGSIVNVTSMNGIAPGANSGAYGSTKAAVALLTQQMGLEWGPLGVRVNAVAPGLIDGGMSEPIYLDASIREARESKVPAGRLGLVEDVANAVMFLASEQSAYITGQQLLVDGGVTMSIIANLPRPAAVDGVGHK